MTTGAGCASGSAGPRFVTRLSAFDAAVEGYEPLKVAPPDPTATVRRGGAAPVARDKGPILFNAYFKTCLVRHCIKWGEKRASVSEREVVPEPTDPGQQQEELVGVCRSLEPIDKVILLGQCLARLNAIDRQILRWSYIDGLPDHEIQDRLATGGVRLGGTIRLRRFRALQRLRQWLEAMPGGPVVTNGGGR